MPHRLPSLLAAPVASNERWWLRNPRVFDAITAAVQDDMVIAIEAGRIARIAHRGDIESDGAREGARTVDLGGRTVLPGLIDVHAHLNPQLPARAPGSEPMWPGATAHFLAAGLQDALRMGVTTLRDVGSYGDLVVEARQAMRYGAFRGPRVLTCGRIVSATAPGGKFFDGMYREADGPDEIRKAVREQLRRGADYIKVMSTGARSVELEDPDPAQLTPDEMTALVEESHRLGYRVAAHAEGIAGTELAIRAGVDTIEHGMYLNQRPDLLDAMAASGQILVPTFSCFYGVAGLGNQIGVDQPVEPATTLAGIVEEWTPLLSELARYNLDQADRTLKAARSAGVAIAAGHDWYPFGGVSIEMMRMHHHGLTAQESLIAATATSAVAAGLDEHVGTITVGKLADIIVVDGDPLQNLELLCHRDNIWLVLQEGQAVAGASLETAPA
jgi:imidazolonepropionase-like amidohydrolase